MQTISFHANQVFTRPVCFGAQLPPPTKNALLALRKQLIDVVDETTAYNADTYQQRKSISPLTGHCGAIAQLLQKRYGGTILKSIITFKLNGKPKRETHLWNRLKIRQGNRVVEQQVDLVSCQYGGDGFYPLTDPKGRIKHQVQGKGVCLEFQHSQFKNERNRITPLPHAVELETRLQKQSRETP